MCQRKSSKTHFTSLVANQVSRSLGRSREFAMTRTQTLIPFRMKKKTTFRARALPCTRLDSPSAQLIANRSTTHHASLIVEEVDGPFSDILAGYSVFLT